MTRSSRPNAVEAPVAQRLEVALLGHVDRLSDRLAAGRLDERGGLLGAVAVEVARHDAGAAGGERQGGGAADAAAGAGQHRGGAVEVHGDGHAIATALVRTNSSSPSRPPSRPKPEMPTPPKGSSQPVTGEAPFT